MPTIDPNNPLGLLFVTSFVVQQILEAIAWPVEKIVGDWWRRKGYADDAWKKTVFGVIGFILGIILAWQLNLHVLEHYIPASSSAAGLRGGVLDTILTALVLSAGTEGTNSVLKYLKYLKEDKKAGAADMVRSLAEASRRTLAPAAPVSPAALQTLEKLRERAGVTAPAGGPGAHASRSGALSYINNK
ncbi:MAG TPA: hypothetical protein VFZ44_14950 [Pyrinomonadaceae bacterium]